MFIMPAVMHSLCCSPWAEALCPVCWVPESALVLVNGVYYLQQGYAARAGTPHYSSIFWSWIPRLAGASAGSLPLLPLLPQQPAYAARSVSKLLICLPFIICLLPVPTKSLSNFCLASIDLLHMHLARAGTRSNCCHYCQQTRCQNMAVSLSML